MWGKNIYNYLILFGSHARGTATPYSDIDILVITNKKLSVKEEEYLYLIASDISLKYDTLISCFSYSEEEFEARKTPFFTEYQKRRDKNMENEEEIKALIKKAETSLLAAKELFKKGFFDFSVSRAYYTMFYCVEALLLTKNLSFSKHI